MPRRKSQASYRFHKHSGQAVVTLMDHLGKRRDVLLDTYDTDASRTEYARVIAEWRAAGSRLPGDSSGDITINELILVYWSHVETYYRHPDGTPTTEPGNTKQALKPLRQLYGHTIAAEFDALALDALRLHRIDAGYSRKRINKDTSRVKALFKWAAARKLISASVWHGLAVVEGLKRGRSAARDTPPVKPADNAAVEKTLPFLLPQTQTMVNLQRLTGMRPGEVCTMRTIDIDAVGKVWVYRPGSDEGEFGRHKNAWRGQDRRILIGPKAQELLKPWLRPLYPEEPVFQPKEAVAAWQEQKRAAGKSNEQPSQLCRAKPRAGKRKPGTAYKPCAYAYRRMDRESGGVDGSAVRRRSVQEPEWSNNRQGTLVCSECLGRVADLTHRRLVRPCRVGETLQRRSQEVARHIAVLAAIQGSRRDLLARLPEEAGSRHRSRRGQTRPVTKGS